MQVGTLEVEGSEIEQNCEMVLRTCGVEHASSGLASRARERLLGPPARSAIQSGVVTRLGHQFAIADHFGESF